MQKTALFTGLAFALIFFSGCSRQEVPRAEAPVPETREVSATVVFIKGEAKTFTKNDWKPLSLGLELQSNDSLDLLKGAQAELKRADGSLAKLVGPVRGSVQELLTAASIEGSAAGNVISKVRKLEGKKQTYSVQTPTAVAGIRGTQARMTPPDTTKKDSLPEE